VDEGIRNHLIMIDAEGELGEADTQNVSKLSKTIINGWRLHSFWAAKLFE
jgi:hypothetical protein